MENKIEPYLEARCKSGYIHGKRGVDLYYEMYLNPAEEGAIVISHGFCEFSAKYNEVIYHFYKLGYSVFIMDHRGHGKSGRELAGFERVYVHRFQDYVDDFDMFLKAKVKPNSISEKYLLYAHSMGGCIGTMYLEQHPEFFTAAILSSPMLGVDYGKYPKWLVMVLTLMEKLIGHDKNYAFGQKGFDGIPHYPTSSCLSESRYEYVFQKRIEHKEYRTYGGTFAWVRAGLFATGKLMRASNIKHIKAPILLFQAGLDTMVDNRAQNRFCRKCTQVEFELVENSKHEIFNSGEMERYRYYRRIDQFLHTYI